MTCGGDFFFLFSKPLHNFIDNKEVCSNRNSKEKKTWDFQNQESLIEKEKQEEQLFTVTMWTTACNILCISKEFKICTE